MSSRTKGVKFPNNPVSSIEELPTNNYSRRARKGLNSKSKKSATVEALLGINNPRPGRIVNKKGFAALTSRLRGFQAEKEAKEIAQELKDKAIVDEFVAAIKAKQESLKSVTRKSRQTRKRR
jgi:hypothetical protein